MSVTDCDWQLEMPNVFTPDGNGINDGFKPVKQSSVEVLEYLIWNRWGNTVFSTTGQDLEWDGKVPSGEMASEGVYYYSLVFRDGTGKEQKAQGFFHLVTK